MIPPFVAARSRIGRALSAGVISALLISMQPAFAADPVPVQPPVSFALGGTLMFDAARFSSDTAPWSDGGNLRRASLSFETEFYQKWAFELQYDFSEDEAEDRLEELSLTYLLSERTSFTLGKLKNPVGLENSTSSKNAMFIEPAAAVKSFTPSRSMSLYFESTGELLSLQGGILIGDGSTDNDALAKDEPGYAFRAVWHPIDTKNKTIHLAAYRLWLEPANSYFEVEAKPETRVVMMNVLDTRKIKSVRGVTVTGLELAWIWGPFTLQSEYFAQAIARTGSLAEINYSGHYIGASWFLTGEGRRYSKSGSFKGVKPDGSSGAWEIAFRTSQIDMSDPAKSVGEMSTRSLGVNWFINESWRLSLNQSQVQSAQLPQNQDMTQFRVQFQF